MMLRVDLDETYSIDPSCSKGIHTIVVGYDIIKYWPQLQSGAPIIQEWLINKNSGADLTHL